MLLSRRKAIFVAAALPFALTRGGRVSAADLEFRDIESQSRQFMRWYEQIRLTPAQEKVKRAALEPIPAPCCNDNSAYTCCCPCNISRTIWGLSQFMIARQNATASQVGAKVREWIKFIGPNGFSGSACYTGGCPRPFHSDGCGGMKPDRLVL